MIQQPPTTLPQSSIQRLTNAVWPYIQGKRALILIAVAIGVLGLALNWSWLVAVGVAPLLLAVLPCAAMCALGLCMNKVWGKSCSTDTKPPLEKPDFKDGSGGGA